MYIITQQRFEVSLNKGSRYHSTKVGGITQQRFEVLQGNEQIRILEYFKE